MRVRVKVVIFLADKSKWGYNYCSYCPAINYPFGCADTPNEVIANVQSYLLKLLCYREIYTNLQNLGWEFTDTSIYWAQNEMYMGGDRKKREKVCRSKGCV